MRLANVIMLVLNAADVHQALPMAETIEAMKQAYAALSNGDAVVPLRTRLPIESRDAAALFMPAFVPGSPADALAIKIVTLFPTNPAKQLPFIHAAVLVMDAETGRMVALIEGGALTSIRTGAGAGAATDLLARPDSREAAIFGTGPQARTQLEAICAVRAIEVARIFSRSPGNIARFMDEMQPKVNARLVPAASPADALKTADIICTATTSTTPVFEHSDVPAGVHINGVGSYTPEMVEIPPATVAGSRVFVDSLSACAAEAGEVIRAVETGLLDADKIVEIGEVASGQAAGRRSPTEITFFKSVGVAVQDAAAAQLALTIAGQKGLGENVGW